MCESCRIASQKRCPFGVGNNEGKCCTTECSAWKTWDTRETKTDVESFWRRDKPGWFSDYKVEDTRMKVVGQRSEAYYPGNPDYTDPQYFDVDVLEKQYLWVKRTSREIGNVGGRCIRLSS